MAGVVPRLARLMPACTQCRIGSEDWSLGSGRPRDSCTFLTLARYDFIVCGERCWSAKYAAKLHSVISVTGKGSDVWNSLQKVSNFLAAESYVRRVDGARPSRKYRRTDGASAVRSSPHRGSATGPVATERGCPGFCWHRVP